MYLAVSHIWTSADSHGDITLFFLFLQTHSLHLNNAMVMLIYPPFYLHALLLVFRPDLLLLTDKDLLYVLELTVGFETNMQSNSYRKAAKYSSLISDLSFSYRKIKFINLFTSAVGAMGSFCNSILFLLNDLHFR